MKPDFENLSLAIAGNLVLDREFNRALKASHSTRVGKVEKPDQLNKLRRSKRIAVVRLNELKATFTQEIDQRAQKITRLGSDLSPLESLDLATRSMVWERELTENGAYYGNFAWNFCLEKTKLPKKTISEIENVALYGFQLLKTCRPCQNGQFTTSEAFINSLSLKPNGARVDIILTASGPKIIEVNLNWVDAIQALSAFNQICQGSSTSEKPTKLLSGTFKPEGKTALINLATGSGSRETGPALEMERLSQSLKRTDLGPKIEIIDPNVIRPSYLATFDNFYINGDPRMIGESTTVPDWLELVYKKLAAGSAKVFPVWRPDLDRKTVLIDVSRINPIFANTAQFPGNNGNTILKGESFSSKKIAFLDSPAAENLLLDAAMFPNEYVVQEALTPERLNPIIGYDTSSGRFAYIPEPFSKFNVWIIDNKIAGTMISFSDNRIISDKDFNTVPVPI